MHKCENITLNYLNTVWEMINWRRIHLQSKHLTRIYCLNYIWNLRDFIVREQITQFKNWQSCRIHKNTNTSSIFISELSEKDIKERVSFITATRINEISRNKFNHEDERSLQQNYCIFIKETVGNSANLVYCDKTASTLNEIG